MFLIGQNERSRPKIVQSMGISSHGWIQILHNIVALVDTTCFKNHKVMYIFVRLILGQKMLPHALYELLKSGLQFQLQH